MFSWSPPAGGGGTPNYGYPGARSSTSPVRAHAINGSIRPPEYTRAQHIDSYMNDATLKRSTRRVSADDSTYDTVFQTTRGETLIVRVHLPNSGDKVCAPAMTLAGVKARHPWLDSKMRIIGYPAITSDEKWKASHMLLGTAVHEVVKHLQLEPPEVLEITDAGLQSIQSGRRNGSRKSAYATASSIATSNSVGRSSRANSRTRDGNDDAPPEYSSVLLNMPDVPREVPELDALSREDLDQLAEDDLEFTAFINKLPIFQTIQSTADDVLNENVKVAKANLEKEERVKTLHKEVTELKCMFETKLNNFQSLELKQDALCAPPDKRDILRQLANGKKEAFIESEQLAEDWVEDGGNVDAFVTSFIEKRRIHHIRAAKMELLQRPHT